MSPLDALVIVVIAIILAINCDEITHQLKRIADALEARNAKGE